MEENENEKNASVNFSFYPETHPDVDLSFHCSEDLTLGQLINYFKIFAIALSFSSESVEKYFNKI